MDEVQKWGSFNNQVKLKTWLKQGSNGRHQATAVAITQVSVATVATWAILANYGLKTCKKGKKFTNLEFSKIFCQP